MRIGIVGYGNLGKTLEKLAVTNKNCEIVGIFSRRKIQSIAPSFNISEAPKFKGKIDVMFMCGGSEKDLLTQTPLFAKNFNTIDTFDTHKLTAKHFDVVNKICKENQTSSIVCAGWDPGIFSVLRILFGSIFENVNCFFGKGTSLGHTNVLKRINGVEDARQVTIPCKKAMGKAKRGKNVTCNSHVRKCFVVAQKGHKQIKKKILSTPNYFKGEKTIIKFVSQKSLQKHFDFSHKGQIICKNEDSSLDLKLSMDSNPLFTAKIMLAYSVALEKIIKEKVYGAFTPLQIPVSWLEKTNTTKTIKKFC